MKLRRLLRYYWLRLSRLRGDPRKLAWGMALGVFVGITPTVPFHMVTVLTLAPLLRVSVVTAYLGIWVMNPLTIVPLYILAFEVGAYLLFPGGVLDLPEVWTWKSALEVLWRGGLALQVGGVIIALPPAVASYFLTLWAVRRQRQRRRNRSVCVQPLSPDAS